MLKEKQVLWPACFLLTNKQMIKWNAEATIRSRRNKINFLLMQTFISILIFVGIIYAVWNMFAGRNTVHLALSRFTIDPEAENQIVVEGRKTGLWQWILAKLKLGNMYRIHVKAGYISYSTDSASGEHLTLTPVQKIASTSCGSRKPVILLIIAGFVLLIGLFMSISASAIPGLGAQGRDMFAYALLTAAVLVVCYYFNKNFYISIQTVGGGKFGFSFKRSYIENVPVNIEKVKEAITRINELVLAAQ